MNNELLYYLTNHAGSMSPREMLLCYVAAIAVGGLIFLSYRFSHSGAVYSARFNASLWMLTLVTTMVMCVIGNNIALSLGMVGALSIVRFRTAIKDARDTAYIFWAIAVGICCGIADYVTSIIGSIIIFLLMLIIGGIKSNNRYLLIIRGSKGIDDEVVSLIDAHFKGKLRLCVHNSGRDFEELIYEMSDIQQKKYTNDKLSAKLYAISSVQQVNLVGQNEEISE